MFLVSITLFLHLSSVQTLPNLLTVAITCHPAVAKLHL
jgi:hypothetical protein